MANKKGYINSRYRTKGDNKSKKTGNQADGSFGCRNSKKKLTKKQVYSSYDLMQLCGLKRAVSVQAAVALFWTEANTTRLERETMCRVDDNT